ncbi:unnamed protein product [Prunus armeniaca]
MGHQEERASTLPPLGHLLHLLHYFCVYELEGIYFGTCEDSMKQATRKKVFTKVKSRRPSKRASRIRKSHPFLPFLLCISEIRPRKILGIW